MTSIVLHSGTFILTTMKRFIAFITTIVLFVTNQIITDTFLVPAHELTVWTEGGLAVRTVCLVTTIMTIILSITLVLLVDTPRVLTRELLRSTRGVLLATLFTLITAISTVIIMVTLPMFVDTSTIVTLELVLFTRGLGSVTRDIAVAGNPLIFTISTVRISVTFPFERDAHWFVEHGILLTCEFFRIITFSVVALLGFILVRTIQTIIISITNINSWYTIAIVTCEQISKASFLLTVTILFGFITAIITVSISITVPRGRNTSVVRTPETVWWTLSLST